MTYDPRKHNRRSIRLKGHDYSSAGQYFITICTHNRQCLFGQVADGIMQLNKPGKIARRNWLRTETMRDNVKLDAFVIMPNHVHGIMQLVGAYCNTPLRDGDSKQKPEFKSPSKTIGAIVRGYKSSVTAKINTLQKTAGQKVWQRNYYDHIIRDEKSLERIRNYITNNPAQWDQDRNNSTNI